MEQEQKLNPMNGNYNTYIKLISRIEEVKDAIKKQNYGIAMDILCKPYPKFITFTGPKDVGDERIRKMLIGFFSNGAFSDSYTNGIPDKDIVAWLEKQGKIAAYYEDRLDECSCKYFNKGYKHALENQGGSKEINLVEILKHYPKETELYSPLYGKLWLAEVDEKNEIITCYKHHLEEGCTRAILEQEDTVSFYSNGTTGLPDFKVSKDCMLFLYDIEKQSEENHAWSDKDEEALLKMMFAFKARVFPSSEECDSFIDFLKSLKNKLQPKQEWSVEDKSKVQRICKYLDEAKKYYADIIEVRECMDWLKSLKERIIE